MHAIINKTKIEKNKIIWSENLKFIFIQFLKANFDQVETPNLGGSTFA